MRRTRLAVLLILLIAASSGQAATLSGRVTSVADGDSFTLVDAKKKMWRVRIQAIDAPERRQSFSRASLTSLKSMLQGKEVIVAIHEQDDYGRVVGRVSVGGRDAGLEQLRAGMVWFYTHYGRDLDPRVRDEYIAAQRDARNAKRGLWSDVRAMPPWQYRRQQRQR